MITTTIANKITGVLNMKMAVIVVLSSIWGFYAPVHGMMEAIGGLVIIDMITGISAAWKERIHPISSKRLFKKLVQIFGLACAVSAVLVAGPGLDAIGLPATSLAQWLCGMYIAYELFSVLENCGRLGVPLVDKVAKLLKIRVQ